MLSLVSILKEIVLVNKNNPYFDSNNNWVVPNVIKYLNSQFPDLKNNILEYVNNESGLESLPLSFKDHNKTQVESLLSDDFQDYVGINEIQIVPRNTIRLGDLQYDKTIRKYPLGKLGWQSYTSRNVENQDDFKYWKDDMINNYGPDLLLIKLKNPKKKYWHQDSYVLKIFK